MLLLKRAVIRGFKREKGTESPDDKCKWKKPRGGKEEMAVKTLFEQIAVLCIARLPGYTGRTGILLYIYWLV